MIFNHVFNVLALIVPGIVTLPNGVNKSVNKAYK